MNIQGSSLRFDFQKIEPKRLVARSEPTAQQKTELQAPLSLASQVNSKLPAVLTGVKSEVSASRETGSPDETTEASAEESVSESTEGLDEADDLSSDYEPDSERPEDDSDELDDQTDEQRQHQGKQLNGLETQYRSRFLILDQLIDRLTATHDFLSGIADKGPPP